MLQCSAIPQPAESYFMNVTALTRLVIKSSTVMEVIIAPFLDRVKLFSSTTVDNAINKRL